MLLRQILIIYKKQDFLVQTPFRNTYFT